MATEYAQCLGAPLVVLHKRRESGAETKVTDIGGDVTGRACLVVDDIISTGGTLAESIKALLEAGTRAEIIVAATHGVLLTGAREKLGQPAVRGVYVTDTVSVAEEQWPQLRVVSIAPMIASALERFVVEERPLAGHPGGRGERR
jgi:ribose-phosphate pyrophosphokinase